MRSRHCHLGDVLRWMTAFPTDRTQQVVYSGMTSVVHDCQLYLSVPVANAQSAAVRLTQCVVDVAECLSASRSPRPRCDRRQPADHVGTRRCCVSVGVWIPTTAPICHTSAIGRSREDSRSCIDLLAS